ncbi:MAG: UDP-glucose 4-epimerase GalE [Flavobacteriales bacterium]
MATFVGMSKYILVTGGAGYIGSHTVVALVEEGYTPVIVDDFRNATDVVIKGLEEIIGFTPIVHRLDVCQLKDLRTLFEQYSFQGIIHFAAYKAVGESVEKPLQYYQNNLVGLMNVLALMEEFQVENFVFSSSCTVYGEPKDIKEVQEETPKSLPESPYGYTKWIGEQIIHDFFRSAPDFHLINLRYFNPVGAHSSAKIGEYPLGKPNNLLPFVTQTAIGKQACLTVFGNDYPTRDGSCVRDYIHVMDLAEAHVKAIQFLEKQEKGCLEAINIGTGTGTTVLEVIHVFEVVSGQALNYQIGPRRTGDVIEIFANADKAQKLLNWKSGRSIHDAVRDAWNWELALNQEK